MKIWPLLCVWAAFAQHEHGMHDHAMEEHAGMAAQPADSFLMAQASGTSVNPQSSHMDMLHSRMGSWNLMLHGAAFFTDVQQTGPRGGDKLFSTNWFMAAADHSLGKGTFQVRGMLSLEPATITQRRYPELFQTGETAFGKPLVDAQHPHDLFMELGVQYVRPLGEKTLLSLYAAPVGDPALGPAAFPHRVSAMELPQAPLGHHHQDSTHIANQVVTAGIQHGILRLEASGFHGAEPNENRWNIDHGAIDSWSGRLWITPNPRWAGQVSVGRLNKPEALEAGDIVRSTASLTYSRPLPTGLWASSFIWGRNHKTAGQRDVNSYLGESVVRFRHKNYLTGRVEVVDKDELLAEESGPVFRVTAYTLGFTRDVDFIPEFETGFGANFTLYSIPAAIQPAYGAHPAGFQVYLRVRLRSGH